MKGEIMFLIAAGLLGFCMAVVTVFILFRLNYGGV